MNDTHDVDTTRKIREHTLSRHKQAERLAWLATFIIILAAILWIGCDVSKSAPHFTISHSGTGSIAGRIVDENQCPLPGVTVLVVGTSRGASTDPDGKYHIISIPIGTYTIQARCVGYQSKDSLNVKVEKDKIISINFTMHTSAVLMQECVVEADAPLVNSYSTCATQTVNSKVIESIPNVNSVGDVLKLQAGVVKQGNTLYLRGGRNNEVQYLVDGKQYGTAFHTEEYDRIYENEFLDALTNPLSTFSIDVDAGSYSNVRRFINNGQLPPADAVRTEEMINYFTYEYPQPKDEHPFSITTEVTDCPWKSGHKLVLVGLQGKKIATDKLPPSNLVFLLDVSGSMNEPDKLPLVKSAFRLLVSQLRSIDRVSIVVYAGRAGLVLPTTYGSEKEKILCAIDQLEAGGSTAGGAGIQLAYKIAKENFLEHGNNRVILATDGDFNVGVSSDAELVRMIEEKRNEGIFLSVLGFGEGNYKDAKMEQLADKGNGNHYYIDNIQEAKKVFIGQMAGTLFTIAKDVKIQIEFNPANVKAYRLIGYENRMLKKEDFNDDKKDAGELGAGHTVTALYEIVPADGKIELASIDSLKYQNVRLIESSSDMQELLTVKFRYKEPSGSTSNLIVKTLMAKSENFDHASKNLQFAAAVTEFSSLLRDSKYKAGVSFDDVLKMAEAAKGNDTEGYRADFIHMIESAKLLHR
jgi:Ca-activated chloride channel family protein